MIDHDNIKESHLVIKNLHLNRKGNSLFAKNLLSFIESNWIFDYDGDSFSEEYCVSNDPIVSHSDVKKALKDIRISNMNKPIFGHLNINSLRNKFDLFSEQVKGSIYILMVSATKLDDSFPEAQFLIEGFYSSFRFDRNINGGGIILCVREDIPTKLLSHDFPCVESFFVEINLHKKKWLVNCSYNPHKSNIINHLNIISRSLDKKILYFSVIFLMHALMIRLCRLFANLTH